MRTDRDNETATTLTARQAKVVLTVFTMGLSVAMQNHRAYEDGLGRLAEMNVEADELNAISIHIRDALVSIYPELRFSEYAFKDEKETDGIMEFIQDILGGVNVERVFVVGADGKVTPFLH